MIKKLFFLLQASAFQEVETDEKNLTQTNDESRYLERKWKIEISNKKPHATLII